jgi:glycosyltransferase involved in cell wall biosynthesis
MEPHRCFPEFMRAVPKLLRADPAIQVAIAGANEVAYGGAGLADRDWKAEALATPDVDWERVHFLGTLIRDDYRALLSRSDVHVYLTVPFVLSWSMLEAMSMACTLVLSDTEPVREFAGHDHAHFVDPSRSEAISEAIAEALATGHDGRGARARDLVVRDLSQDVLRAEMQAFLLGLL